MFMANITWIELNSCFNSGMCFSSRSIVNWWKCITRNCWKQEYLTNRANCGNKAFSGLDFEKLKEFQLIKQMGEVVDVFVELDETASLLADAYEELAQDSWNPRVLSEVFPGWKKQTRPSVYERRHLRRLLLSKMSEYMIQIRYKRAIANLPLEFQARNGVKATFLWIPPSEVQRYYDPVTGFRDETGEAFIV